MDLRESFIEEFGFEPTHRVSSGGRFEILGNHTDHNHGLCIAATCNLSIFGFLKPRQDLKINCISLGYPTIKLSLDNLDLVEQDKGTSNALIRGIARIFVDNGYKIGGFDMITDSTIFAGAGVSSSAAFESLIGQIFNILFNDGNVDKLFIARAGQYAENYDFGKKCGLLDQIGTGYGNISFIDFKEIKNPIVEQIKFPFSDLHFVIVNTGSSHAHLSYLYSAIPKDMWNAAHKMGHEFLRECSKNDLNIDLTEIEKNRALHFFNENERVKNMKSAIEVNDQKSFLRLINESRQSSSDLLKNMMVENNYEGSPLEACDLAMKILEEDGACKINGGGFAGSIICVVPSNKLSEFIEVMSEKYDRKNVCEVSVATHGPLVEKI